MGGTRESSAAATAVVSNPRFRIGETIVRRGSVPPLKGERRDRERAGRRKLQGEGEGVVKWWWWWEQARWRRVTEG